MTLSSGEEAETYGRLDVGELHDAGVEGFLQRWRHVVVGGAQYRVVNVDEHAVRLVH